MRAPIHRAFLLTALLLGTLRAETDVCGTLKLAQEWTAQESPYRITGNIYVPETSQLRIGPGVEVLFDARPKPCPEAGPAPDPTDHADSILISMNIEGPFYCIGEPDKPILFRPQKPFGAAGWEGIRLAGQAPGSAEIAFAEFHEANRAVYAEKTAFVLHHVLFEDNNVGIWLGLRGDVTVLNCDFVNNRGTGIRVEEASPRIANNIFCRNLAYGIWVSEGGNFSIAYNDFFENREEDCFHCPYSVLRPAGKNANGDTSDAFFNLRSDPVFEGSASYKAMLAGDPSQDTPEHLVKDPKLADMEKKSRLQFWKHAPEEPPPFSPRGKGPYVLSRYSKLIRAGHPAKDLRNPDQTTADIGLHGGPSGRINPDPF